MDREKSRDLLLILITKPYRYESDSIHYRKEALLSFVSVEALKFAD